MPPSMSKAVPRSGERKKTHARQTTWKVTSQPAHFGQETPAKRPRAQRSMPSTPPWIPPQITKVKDAPCQSPPSRKVSIRLR